MYVANYANHSVTAYAAGANGNARTLQYIKGSATKLKDLWGIALDRSDNIYVANGDYNWITVYAAGSTGNVVPINRIKGTRTGLAAAAGIAIR